MSFISLPKGKLRKKTETKKLKNFAAGYLGRFYIETWQIMLTVLSVQIFMEGLPAMLIYLQTMSKNISWQPVTFLKKCKMTSTIS